MESTEIWGNAQFWLEGWYTIEELEDVLKALKEAKARHDVALANSMKQRGVMK